MAPTDFDEGPDTHVSGAVPDFEAEDRTTPCRVLCLECQAPAMPGGALATTVAEWERVENSAACLRGDGWKYCARSGWLGLRLRRA